MGPGVRGLVRDKRNCAQFLLVKKEQTAAKPKHTKGFARGALVGKAVGIPCLKAFAHLTSVLVDPQKP